MFTLPPAGYYTITLAVPLKPRTSFALPPPRYLVRLRFSAQRRTRAATRIVAFTWVAGWILPFIRANRHGVKLDRSNIGTFRRSRIGSGRTCGRFSCYLRLCRLRTHATPFRRSFVLFSLPMFILLLCSLCSTPLLRALLPILSAFPVTARVIMTVDTTSYRLPTRSPPTPSATLMTVRFQTSFVIPEHRAC